MENGLFTGLSHVTFDNSLFMIRAFAIKAGRQGYMDDSRLKRIGAELKKARTRRDEWEGRVKELERKYKEAENTCIHDMVHAANLSPEQLALLIEQSRRAVPNGDPEELFDQSEEGA